ncbi:MAG: hypothetical protein P4N24_14620 [Acidobacteriota bacterium]|nr:hypothetical protein [Acidobacteriota bacterium]
MSRRNKTEKQITNYTKTNSYVRYPTWSSHGDQIVYEYTETTGNIWMMRMNQLDGRLIYHEAVFPG